MSPPKDLIKYEKFRRNCKEAAQNRAQDPEWIRKHKEEMQKRAQNPEWRHKNRESAQKRSQTPEWQRANKEGNRNRNKNFCKDPKWLRENREKLQKLRQNPEFQLKKQEGHVGGFWYGNIRYPDPPQYCVFWCPNLFERIDKAQNYKSILSGKTKFDNGDIALSRHHVYWQPKACCEWDEDAQGYYTLINIRTLKHPNHVKYYIPGDPNKFVLLTMQEHRMIVKDKLKWIKIFENLIETKLGGICYLPKIEA